MKTGHWRIGTVCGQVTARVVHLVMGDPAGRGALRGGQAAGPKSPGATLPGAAGSSGEKVPVSPPSGPAG